MTKITAAMVRDLREMTQAGMMDCKKALVEADGDMSVASDLLRKKSGAKASKAATRIAAEGVIRLALSEDQKCAVMLELNSETDFVARDTHFVTFAEQLAARALAENCQTVEAVLAMAVEAGDDKTFEHRRQELVAKLGENIQLRRVVAMQADGGIGSYVHGDRLGTLVALNKSNADLAKDLAMHITASNPQAIAEGDMDANVVAKEREIYTAQAQESGKPDNIIAKMVEGRVNKFLQENCLVSQPFVKDPDQKIADLLKVDGITVTGFVRYELGEGIEKKSVDFAEEVRAQLED